MVSCTQPIRVVYQYLEPVAVPTVEVIEMELKKIDWYDNYVVSNGQVFGIDGSKLVPVIPESKEGDKLSFSEFFKKDNYVYFTIIDGEETLYYQQYTDDLVVLTKSKYPEIPASSRISVVANPYKIEKDTYQKDDKAEIQEISRVYRDSLVEAYISIDGSCRTDGGFWFSVPESFSTRYEGVYYWPLDNSKVRIKNTGRIW